MKNFFKIILPPFFFIIYRKFFLKREFLRGFSDWESAVKNSTTYDTDEVFNKTLDAARKVRDGLVAFERDSVLFEKIDYDWPLLASLLLVANQSNRLNVVDIGGALGTSYQQNKKFLQMLNCPISWTIVEQSRFVKIGNTEFLTEELFFSDSLNELNFDTDLVLLGGSICYIKEPFTILDKILEANPKFIIITRTPFSDSSRDTLSVQIVHPSIYNASYPIWTFSEANFKKYLSSKYDLIEEWKDYFQADTKAVAKGFLFRRKKFTNNY